MELIRNDDCLDDRLSKGVVAIGAGAALLVAGSFFGGNGVEGIFQGANDMLLGQDPIIHYVGGVGNLIMSGFSYINSIVLFGYGIKNV